MATRHLHCSTTGQTDDYRRDWQYVKRPRHDRGFSTLPDNT